MILGPRDGHRYLGTFGVTIEQKIRRYTLIEQLALGRKNVTRARAVSYILEGKPLPR